VKIKYFYFFILCLILTTGAPAQNPIDGLSRWTMLRPKSGFEKQFEESYKRHLKWHTETGDKWNWYGWFVSSGERDGAFIDITFGHRWEDFDKPIDPKADAADFNESVAPFAEVLIQFVCTNLTEYGSGTQADLSAAQPQIFRFKVKPGYESDFEMFLKDFRSAMGKIAPEQKFFWFRVEDGDQTPQYLLFLSFGSFAEREKSKNFLTRITAEIPAMRTYFQNSVAEIKLETLRFRADMTSIPK